MLELHLLCGIYSWRRSRRHGKTVLHLALQKLIEALQEEEGDEDNEDAHVEIAVQNVNAQECLEQEHNDCTYKENAAKEDLC